MSNQFAEAVEAFRRGDIDRARAIAERKIVSGPSPQWQHLLGLIHCRTGDPETGVELFRSALEAAPENLEIRVMLSRALVDLGRAREVLDMPEPSPPESPALLALWEARAEAAERSGDGPAAVRALTVVANAKSDDARAWINLGRALLRLDRFAEAQDVYRRALAIAPRDTDAISELALLYERMSRIDSLSALLESAIERGVAKDRLALAWALLEQRRGNSAEAQSLLSKADPGGDLARYWRLKAMIEDSLCNEGEAFAAAVAMNRATGNLADWRRRSAAYRLELRKLETAITRDWGAEIDPLPATSRLPVFLLGFPRSGTTLLDTFLMGHRDIAVLEEHPLLFKAGEKLGPLERLPNARRDALVAARDEYARSLAERAGAGRSATVIDKFPLNMVAAPLIHALFPGAPILFVERHPCDSVLSGFMQAFVANLGMANFLDIGDAADFYDCCMRVWTASRNALPLNVHVVRYESLVADPEATLRPVIDFLGLDWDERLLDHEATAARRGLIANTSYNQVTEPLTKAPVFRWRRYERELEAVLPVLLPWSKRLGYDS